MLWDRLSPVLRKAENTVLNPSYIVAFAMTVSPGLFLLWVAWGPLLNSCRVELLLSTLHCWTNLGHRCCSKVVFRASPWRKKVCEVSGPGMKLQNLGESSNFSKPQRRHFENCEALIEGEKSVKDSIFHLLVVVLFSWDYQPPDSLHPWKRAWDACLFTCLGLTECARSRG